MNCSVTLLREIRELGMGMQNIKMAREKIKLSREQPILANGKLKLTRG